MTYQDANAIIAGLREAAKVRNGYDDKVLARKCSISSSQIRNRAHLHELPNLDFWAVVTMADEAGLNINFTRRE